jgi:hypothetical protein
MGENMFTPFLRQTVKDEYKAIHDFALRIRNSGVSLLANKRGDLDRVDLGSAIRIQPVQWRVWQRENLLSLIVRPFHLRRCAARAHDCTALSKSDANRTSALLKLNGRSTSRLVGQALCGSARESACRRSSARVISSGQHIKKRDHCARWAGGLAV